MDDVEERLVARAQQPVREDVWMRVAAVARDGVDGLHLLGSHLEQELMRAPDDLVLVHTRPQHPVDLVVDGVDEPGRLVEEHDLLRRLDRSRREKHLRSVGDVHPGPAERLERHEVRHVDAQWLVEQPSLPQLVRDLAGQSIGDPGLVRHRAAHRRDACAEVLGGKPRSEQLMVARRRSEVPEDRVGSSHEKREARVLVPCPLADVRARDIADVVGVEQQHRPQVGCLEGRLGAVEALLPQPREVDALLPVDGARRVGGAAGAASHVHRSTSC